VALQPAHREANHVDHGYARCQSRRPRSACDGTCRWAIPTSIAVMEEWSDGVMKNKPKNVQPSRSRSSSHHSKTPRLHHSRSSHHSTTPPLHHSDSSFWEERYQSGDMPWEKGAPSPGLVDFLAAHPKLTRGTVCVPGCGTGHDVRAWAGAGFDVSGYDIAPSAIRLAAERTQEAGLAAQFQLGDFL